MNNKRKILIIVGTLLAMALVAALLVLWLVPGNNAGAPAGNDTGVVSDSQSGETDGAEETQDTTIDGPAIGVEVENTEDAGNTGNSGNSGNTGNSGNSGNAGNTGNGGNNGVIDFDDLLGN